MDPELDFGGPYSRAGFWGGHNYLFHVKILLALLLAIGNIAVSGAWPPASLLDLPLERGC